MKVEGNSALTADAQAPASAGPSNKTFGLTVGGILAAIGVLRIALIGDVDTAALILAGIGGTLVVAGLCLPQVLTWPNRAWMGLGVLLGRISNPIILFVIYLIVFVPIGVYMRLRGHDPLRSRASAKRAATYWVTPEPTSTLIDRMDRQF